MVRGVVNQAVFEYCSIDSLLGVRPLSEAIAELQWYEDQATKKGFHDLHIVSHRGEYDEYFKIMGTRPETDKEYASRLAKNAKEKARVMAKRKSNKEKKRQAMAREYHEMHLAFNEPTAKQCPICKEVDVRE